MEALKTDHLLLKLILRLNRIRLSTHLLGRIDFDRGLTFMSLK